MKRIAPKWPFKSDDEICRSTPILLSSGILLGSFFASAKQQGIDWPKSRQIGVINRPVLVFRWEDVERWLLQHGQRAVGTIQYYNELQDALKAQDHLPSTVIDCDHNEVKCKELIIKEILSNSTPHIVACGIYFLIDGIEIVYVGKSDNSISSRVASHKDKKFDRVSILRCERGHLNDKENYFIKLLKPKYNIVLNPDRSIYAGFLRKLRNNENLRNKRENP